MYPTEVQILSILASHSCTVETLFSKCEDRSENRCVLRKPERCSRYKNGALNPCLRDAVTQAAWQRGMSKV